MAQASSNDLLSSILFQVQIANAHIEKISNGKSDNITKEATSGLKNPIKKLKGVTTEAANAIKTLSSIGLKDIVKISIMPLEKIALKVNAFVKTLAKVTKEEAERASASANAITSILDIFKGINPIELAIKLKLFPEKQLNKFCDSVGKFMDSLTKTFKGKFDKKEREALNEKINVLGDITSTLLKTLLKVSLIGLLTPVLVPLGVLGFATISLYLVGFTLINKLLNVIGSPKQLDDVSSSIKNIALMALLSAGMVLASAAIGFLITQPKVILMVLAGFAAIMGTMILLKGVLWVIGKMGSPQNIAENTSGIMGSVGLILASALIPLAAIGIGALLLKPGVLGMAIAGFAAITMVLFSFAGIAKIINKVGKQSEQSMTSAISIILLAGSSILLVLAALGIGLLLDKSGGWPYLMQGLGAAAAVIIEFGVLATAIGAVSKIIASKNALIAMGAIMGLATISILLTKEVMKLSGFFGDDIGAGWARFGSTLGAMAAMVGSFALLATAIGGLMMIPMMPLIMGSGVVMMLGLSAAIAALAGAIKKVMEVSLIMGGTGEDTTKAPITNMIYFLSKTKNLLKAAVKLGKSMNFGDVMKTIIAINGVVGAMGGYAKILQTVGGKDGFVKGINGYDKDGNPIYGDDVDIAKTSDNLANGFGTFVEIVMGKLNAIDWKSFKLTTILKISLLMNPISQFAKIIQEVGAEEGKIRTIKHYDENGNPVYGDNIEIVPVAKNISEGFAIFAENIMNGLQKTSTRMGDLRKANIIATLMEPVSKFAKVIQDFGAGKNEDELVSLTFDENGNVSGKETINVKTIATRIANCFDTFMTQMQTTLNKFKTPVFSLNKVDVSDIIDPVIEVIEKMRDKLQSSDVDNFIKNVDNIGKSFSNMQNLYVSKEAKDLNKLFPDLTKNHVAFIDKMNTAMKNIKSPLEKYVKQVERLVDAYDKLSKKYDANGNLVLTLEENTNTNTTVNVDKGALENLADDISTKITDGTKEAINNLSITMQNPVKNATMPNIALEISTN